MSLKTSALKTGIKNALLTLQDRENPLSVEQSAEYLAGQLSALFESFVKSGTVNFTAGKVTGVTNVQGSPVPLASGVAIGGEIT